MSKLRFAPLIRVSTEKQAEKGESLNTQKKQIIQYVETLGGVLIKDPWQYSGQEHSSPGYERKKLDQLLQDSASNNFDAVIITHHDRLGRDSLKSKLALERLRNNGVKFYVGIMEVDLHNEAHMLMTALFNEFAEYQAATGARRSLESRIKRAEKGYPTVGSLPYGRTFDKETEEWGVDLEKRDFIRIIAKLYINGESIDKLAKTYGMGYAHLLKILRERCGDKWMQLFESKRLNINVEIPTKIPRLLRESVIKKIHKRIEANRTYTHGEYKNRYLLSSLIFCENCGRPLSGHPVGKKYRYYNHKKNERQEGCINSVNADRIEEAVLLHLIKMYGDKEYLEQAMARVYPNTERNAQLREE